MTDLERQLLGFPTRAIVETVSPLSERLEKSTKWIKVGSHFKCSIGDESEKCVLVTKLADGRLLFLGTERIWSTDWKSVTPFDDKYDLTDFFTSACEMLRQNEDPV